VGIHHTECSRFSCSLAKNQSCHLCQNTIVTSFQQSCVHSLLDRVHSSSVSAYRSFSTLNSWPSVSLEYEIPNVQCSTSYMLHSCKLKPYNNTVQQLHQISSFYIITAFTHLTNDKLDISVTIKLTQLH
jgi:hypothetical protein